MSVDTRLLIPPADVVARLMVQMAIGTEPVEEGEDGAWPVYTPREPDDPDECLTVRTTTPTDDGREMIGGQRRQHYGIQIRVRARTEEACWNKANEIEVWLNEAVYEESVTVGANHYTVHCFVRTNVIPLGKGLPSNVRNLATVNAMVAITRID